MAAGWADVAQLRPRLRPISLHDLMKSGENPVDLIERDRQTRSPIKPRVTNTNETCGPHKVSDVESVVTNLSTPNPKPRRLYPEIGYGEVDGCTGFPRLQ